MKSIESQILDRISSQGYGWTFSAKDFINLGSREAIDIGLHRIEKKKIIRRVIRGIYDYPKKGKLTGGLISPDPFTVAQTIARRNNWKIIPNGETALNVLGLSTQMPVAFIFFSNGQNRSYQLGKFEIIFKHKIAKDFFKTSDIEDLIIQSIKTLGKDGIDNTKIRIMRKKLSRQGRQQLLNHAQYGTEWIFRVIKKICMAEENE